MKRIWLFVLIVLTVMTTEAQEMIHPDLMGSRLEQAVVEDYKPNFVEMYSRAREILYTEIYNIDDSVHTIYTDHTLYLPPSEEYPIQFLAMNAQPNGINAEHIYPRSKGARETNGNAFSDMHNLAPCRWEVNEARSNFAFAEILDTDTDQWFYKDTKLSNPDELSNEEIQKYSEVDVYPNNFGYFEPREEVKGDIARAVFYFYTMYREAALEADPDFFEDMKADLCEWQANDPVDELELSRTQAIAVYQDGKANPFVADCTLASRMYCENNPPNCQDLSTSTIETSLDLAEDFDPQIQVLPNPNEGIFKLDISNIKPHNYSLRIFDQSGKKMYDINERLDYFNTINMWNVKEGLYFVHLINHDTGKKYSTTFSIGA